MRVITSSEPVLFRIVSLSFPPGTKIAYCSIVSPTYLSSLFSLSSSLEKADGLGKPYDSRLATKLTVRCRRVRRSRNRTVEVWAKRGVVFIANALSRIFSLISKKRARFVRFGEAE